MDLINSIPLIGPFLATALPFLIVLSIVVAIHELGHLMVGRWCGIKADVYSIGFGKVLWSRVDRHGTRWQLAALPLGGFVKFVGDMDPASAGRVEDDDLSPEDRARAFHNAALWRRTLTVLAGPVANFILSVAIFFGLALYAGKASNDPVIGDIGELNPQVVGFQSGDKVLNVAGTEVTTFVELLTALDSLQGQPSQVTVERDGKQQDITVDYSIAPLITGLTLDGAAAATGDVIPGDFIRTINGEVVTSRRAVQIVVADLEPGQRIELGLERDGELLNVSLTPRMTVRVHPVTKEEKPYPLIGVEMADIDGLLPQALPISVVEALEVAVMRVVGIITQTFRFLKAMIFDGASTKHLSGPIGIAKFSGDAAEEGTLALIRLVAFLSTAVGLFNLFPIPVLDGGHLMFYLFEALRGRPAGEASIRLGTMVGLSLVLLLMVFVTYNDVMKL